MSLPTLLRALALWCVTRSIAPFQNVKPLIWIESVIERHSHSRVEYMIKAKSHFKRRSTANNVQIVIPVPADADSPSFKVRARWLSLQARKANSVCVGLACRLPLPRLTPRLLPPVPLKTIVGTCKYAPEKSAIIWTIKQFPGGKEFLMKVRAPVRLNTTWRPPESSGWRHRDQRQLTPVSPATTQAHFNLPSVESEEKEQRPPISVNFEIPYFTTSGIQVRYLKIIEKSGYQALPWVRYITNNGDYQIRTM